MSPLFRLQAVFRGAERLCQGVAVVILVIIRATCPLATDGLENQLQAWHPMHGSTYLASGTKGGVWQGDMGRVAQCIQIYQLPGRVVTKPAGWNRCSTLADEGLDYQAKMSFQGLSNTCHIPWRGECSTVECIVRGVETRKPCCLMSSVLGPPPDLVTFFRRVSLVCILQSDRQRCG